LSEAAFMPFDVATEVTLDGLADEINREHEAAAAGGSTGGERA
jgi:hypothetical protein